jgi:hypothetical protein
MSLNNAASITGPINGDYSSIGVNPRMLQAWATQVEHIANVHEERINMLTTAINDLQWARTFMDWAATNHPELLKEYATVRQVEARLEESNT